MGEIAPIVSGAVRTLMDSELAGKSLLGVKEPCDFLTLTRKGE